jgi:hypothetical protein
MRIDGLSEKLQALAGTGGGGPPAAPAASPQASVAGTIGRARTLFSLFDSVDVAPTPQGAAAVPDVVKDAQSLREMWTRIKAEDINALNNQLRSAGLPPLEVPK